MTPENNRTFAEFLGASRTYPTGDYEMYGHIEIIEDGPEEKHFFFPKEMLFDNSLDWLIPVVRKITQDDRFIDQDEREHLMDIVPYGKIEDTYNAVLAFINWYNSNYI